MSGLPNINAPHLLSLFDLFVASVTEALVVGLGALLLQVKDGCREARHVMEHCHVLVPRGNQELARRVERYGRHCAWKWNYS
jgi:hypothetical protein